MIQPSPLPFRHPGTLSSTDTAHNTRVFDIEGEMWAEPVPRALFLRTEIDLEDGTARVESVRQERSR